MEKAIHFGREEGIEMIEYLLAQNNEQGKFFRELLDKILEENMGK